MRHHLLTSAIFAVLLAALGCDDGENSARETCLAHCEHVGAAQGCPDRVANEDVAECKRGCDVTLQLWSDECVDAAEDMWLCSMSEFTYKCDQGSAEPYSEESGCEDESEAFGMCMMGGG